ncbi:UDP-3-O-[3-hydroxymyristoyl] glucosamine N-acyltransferase [Aureimonas altamirensis DSM 21988]|uniref:UDP-3-O-acylglucosamine N-acyltransferase n=1 Tax=Aureimonas altamirensis DSM 21988 TaxID=1121026 RepID=A0ABY1I9C3_9HYPH|nr:UDP-3-O-(3-hydroxymyristoyl)glucosamine N-acyltransferase [Aureimonas altamirensis]SHI71927.1 UDP-3-O-[3-hydroxymyristoyl] glucosamine N-acyltransferase [Aureimonas altamirensis DSM 21988]
MNETSFFSRGEPKTLGSLAALCSGVLEQAEAGELPIDGIATLERAGPTDISFFDNPNYEHELAVTRAGAIIVAERYSKLVPAGIARLVVADTQTAFAKVGAALFPAAMSPSAFGGEGGISPQASVHPTARIEDGATIEPFAVVGPDVEIGSGTVIGAGAAVGGGCRVGRDCAIGAGVSLQHALLGNRVILHPGVRIGQDGFGYAIGREGILKQVQIGRVIVQDNVEIGANSTVDRGAVRDTVIGENTKIDNQVQIAHNVRIGRNCVIVSQVGIAGSATIEDNVAIGGQSGVNGHVTVGKGAQIAAVSTVAGDVPPGARWGGTPARPVRDWLREVTWLREMARAKRTTGGQE